MLNPQGALRRRVRRLSIILPRTKIKKIRVLHMRFENLTPFISRWMTALKSFLKKDMLETPKSTVLKLEKTPMLDKLFASLESLSHFTTVLSHVEEILTLLGDSYVKDQDTRDAAIDSIVVLLLQYKTNGLVEAVAPTPSL